MITRRNSGTLTTRQVLVECIGLNPAHITEADEKRVERILTDLGMVRVTRRFASVESQVWVDPKVETRGGYQTRNGGARGAK